MLVPTPEFLDWIQTCPLHRKENTLEKRKIVSPFADYRLSCHLEAKSSLSLYTKSMNWTIWQPRETRGEGVGRGWDGWMASSTPWAWIWANTRRWWRTRKPGVLQSMGSQRVGHDWATEQWQHKAYSSGKWVQPFLAVFFGRVVFLNVSFKDSAIHTTWSRYLGCADPVSLL